MFYDVLQQLADKINLYQYNKARFENERQKSAALRAMGIKNVKDELQLIMTADDSNAMDFAKTVRNMGRLNPKIKLMTQL